MIAVSLDAARPRVLAVLLSAVLTIVAPLAAGALPAAAAAPARVAPAAPAQPLVAEPAAPVDEADPLVSPYSADPLPTVQIDGVVWEQIVVGDVVYAMGSFATARPAGSPAGENTVPRGNMLAYDIDTGELIESFAPAFDATVRDAVASADGTSLFVVGEFQSVNGAPRYRMAKIDAVTGAVDPGFTVGTGTAIRSVARIGEVVYFGGGFTSVEGTARQRLAAVDADTGALLP